MGLSRCCKVIAYQISATLQQISEVEIEDRHFSIVIVTSLHLSSRKFLKRVT